MVLKLSMLLFLWGCVQNVTASCDINNFRKTHQHQGLLQKRLIGEWNNSFNEKLITVADIDGNPWNYYTLESRAVNADRLILFLHGFPEFAWAWEQQLAYFGERYHAVAIDLKGHHYSSRPDTVNEYDFIELSYEIRAIINCLGYQQATIVGHDLGGAITWVMGMLHPDVVERLVVMSVAHPYLFGKALLNPESDQRERSHYIQLARGESLQDSVYFTATILRDRDFTRNNFYRNKRFLRLLSESWLPSNRWRPMRHYYRAMPLPPSAQDFPETLTGLQKQIYRIKRPTLLLRGRHDRYFAEEAYQGIEALVPDLQIHVYEEGTHWINHEAVDLNERIDAFISEAIN